MEVKMIEEYNLKLRENGKNELGDGALEIEGRKYDCKLESNNEIRATSLYNEYLFR